MGTTLAIARREFRSFFNSPVAYIVIGVFLVVAGWLYFSTVFVAGQASLRGFFSIAPVLFVVFVVLFLLFGPAPFGSLLGRAFVPFGGQQIATRTQVSIVRPQGGDAVVTIGNPVTIVARVEGRVPAARDRDAPCLLYRHDPAEPYRQRILDLFSSCKGNLVRVHEELLAGGAALSYQALTAFCRRHGIGQTPTAPIGRYEFAPGEELRTEISAKFTRARLRSDLAAAGLRLDKWYTDTANRFALAFARRA